MQLGNFKYCCGVVELGDFGYTSVTSTKDVADFIVESANQTGWGLGLANPYKSYTITVATVNEKQEKVGKILVKLGFNVATTFVNPKTSNKVTLLWANTKELIQKCTDIISKKTRVNKKKLEPLVEYDFHEIEDDV